jgi:hypothetical protein
MLNDSVGFTCGTNALDSCIYRGSDFSFDISVVGALTFVVVNPYSYHHHDRQLSKPLLGR